MNAAQLITAVTLAGSQPPPATINNAITRLAGQPLTADVWTVPMPGTNLIPTGGYDNPDTRTAYLSKNLYNPVARLAGHQLQQPGDPMDWAGWGVLTLGHEVAHLLKIENEKAAEQWALAHLEALTNLLGVHGRVADYVEAAGRKAYAARAAAYASGKDVNAQG